MIGLLVEEDHCSWMCVYSIDIDECQLLIFLHRKGKGTLKNVTRALGRELKRDWVIKVSIGDCNAKRNLSELNGLECKPKESKKCWKNKKYQFHINL